MQPLTCFTFKESNDAFTTKHFLHPARRGFPF